MHETINSIEELENWFNNLDVQEEINNKLEAMAESGELQEIISEYLNSKAVFGYDTVADMVSATNLINGSYAKTLGYYEINDGGAATYRIRTVTNEDVIDGGSIIAMDDETLVAELIIDDYEINAQVFGLKGNGTDDDAPYIQNAIDYAKKLIQDKQANYYSFAGNISIILPAKKLYLKTGITCNEAINLIGAGTGSTLILSANIERVIYYEKDNNSMTTDEEAHLEGVQIKNIRFDGNKRGYTCTAFLSLKWIDHGVFENLWFYCVKGKSIELKGIRESVFNNIFTRFCGVLGSGDIEIIENTGGDTSNLNFGNNWNIVFPFGSAIKFDHGEFSNISNLMVHFPWTSLINQFATIFGTNEYNDTNHNMIDLINSNISITNGSSVYCPAKSVYINASESNFTLSNFKLTAHNGSASTHGGNGNFIKLASNSTGRLGSNVWCSEGGQDPDLVVCDSTSKLYGSFDYSITTQSWIKDGLTNYQRASEFEFAGEKQKPIKLGFATSDYQKTVSTDLVRSMMAFGTLTDESPFNSLISDDDIFFIGTNRYYTRGVVGVGDGSVLRLPQVEQGGTIAISNALYVASDGSLKFVTYDGTNYTTHTITMS